MHSHLILYNILFSLYEFFFTWFYKKIGFCIISNYNLIYYGAFFFNYNNKFNILKNRAWISTVANHLPLFLFNLKNFDIILNFHSYLQKA